MSTRSRIGRVTPSGLIYSIYCHSDGYLDGVGRTLREHYTDPTKIAALIKLGDISSLEEEVAPPVGAEHSFDAPMPGVVRAYGRDRGETNCGYLVSKNEREFVEIASGQEYIYLWDAGRWRVWCTHDGSTIRGGELTAELIANAMTA